MMDIHQHDMDLMRSTWRSVPPECKSKHPDLVSRVWLTADGPKIGIFKREGAFTLEHDGETYRFDKLTKAEDAAVQLLAADHDMTGDW